MKIPRFLPKFQGINVIQPFVVYLINIMTGSDNVAVTIFPFVVYENKYIPRNFVHRSQQIIHLQHQMEIGIIAVIIYLILGFTLNEWVKTIPILWLYQFVYVAFYIRLRIRGYSHKYALYRIPLNIEAKRHGNVLNYYVLRRPFAWFRYIV
jgi:hypothetical protein